MNETVTSAWKENEHGVIVHRVTKPDGAEDMINYTAVLGGISWPSNISPGYACILGELWDGQVKSLGEKRRRGQLRFLGEYRSDSLSMEDFFRKITDGASMFYCDKFFAVLSDEWEGYQEAFRDYISEKEIKKPSISLEEAPYSDNFLFGIQLIRDFRRDGKIFVPEESTLHGQITSISREDLEDSPELKFWAVNALRFVVGAFQKYDYGPVSFNINPKRISSWMER